MSRAVWVVPARPGVIAASASLVLLLVGAGAARGQTAPPPPRPGVGTQGASAQPGHSLGASVRAGAGWTRQVFADATGVEPERSGRHASGAVTLAYGYQGRRSTVDAVASSSVFHAPTFADEVRYAHVGQVNMSRQVGRRTSMFATAEVGYQPVNVISLFPGMFGNIAPVPVDYGLDLVSGRYLSYGASANLEHELTRRSWLEGGASYRRSDWAGGDLDVESVSFFGRYRREIGRGVSFRLGYARGRGDYRFGDSERDVYTDTIDAGVDYGRTLSVSRETSLSFSTGTSAVTSEGRTRWDLVGSAVLTHQIGRTWAAAVSYNRQSGFVDVLAEPAFTDAVSGSLSGLLGQHVSLSLGAGASRGTVGIIDGNEFSAQHATAGLQTSVTRLVGVNVSYIYYRYRFGSTAFLPADFGNRVHQHSVQASITLGVPLLSNARTTNASR